MTDDNKPKLMSIKFLLQGNEFVPNDDHTSSSNLSASIPSLAAPPYPVHPPHDLSPVNALPVDMQALSISGRQKYPSVTAIPQPSNSADTRYMLQPDHLNYSRTRQHSHARSFSDYTHPYPSSAPSLFSARPSAPYLAAPHLYQHRRAISANTADFYTDPSWHPSPSSPSSSPSSKFKTIAPTPTRTKSALTSNTVVDTTTIPNSPSDSEDEIDEEEQRSPSPSNSSSSSSVNLGVDSNGRPNRYQCTYCQKAFSRPSSLRIHTYTHTGERPFVCDAPNCGRRFSVQSNMRRHLRVHRMGRQTKRYRGGTTHPAHP
ncbi:hypothetical protein INT44_008255 [Umbelopsis vinacea]|uniref:C2H2-type domain-containing protein n=2 Tax=Umbelopsis TaxID=64561 RepID=A0A8H7PW79_9FUNG|nr:hypothetical protein INT44_008255 [Umbelopsis vinacea]